MQIDGSHHRWLDEQGPQFTLLLAVDGATSAVLNAVFRPEEDTRGYFVLMQGLIQRGGVPLPGMGIARACSSSPESPNTSSRRWKPPTSSGPWWNWASSRFAPAHPRPRAGWNEWREPLR